MVRRSRILILLTVLLCITTFVSYRLSGFYFTKQQAIHDAIRALGLDDATIRYQKKQNLTRLVLIETEEGLVPININQHNPIKYSIDAITLDNYRTPPKKIVNYALNRLFYAFFDATTQRFLIVAPGVDTIEAMVLNEETKQLEPIDSEHMLRKESDGVFETSIEEANQYTYVFRDSDGNRLYTSKLFGNNTVVVTHINQDKLERARFVNPLVLYSGDEQTSIVDDDVIFHVKYRSDAQSMPVFYETILNVERNSPYYDEVEMWIKPSVRQAYEQWVHDGLNPNSNITFTVITKTMQSSEDDPILNAYTTDVMSYLKIIDTFNP